VSVDVQLHAPGPLNGRVLAPRRTKLCFVAPFAYPVLARDRDTQVVGGAEVQQCLLAREFVQRGYEVSMVCMNFGQPNRQVIDGITVHRMHTPDEGVPGLRFLHPRLTSLWRAMAQADADVYYQRAAAALTGFVVAFARRHGRASLFASACDLDFDARLPLIGYARDRALFRWGVRHATAIVTQTPAQQQACERQFGRVASVVRSCYAHAGRAAERGGAVLWVASVKELKRPELFIELARRCPEYRFRLVGGGNAAYMASLKALAQELGNLDFTGFVPFADVEQQFDGAALLVNTSIGEGFPNTFLQSWSRGIPTVSFFDPQANMNGRPVGFVVPHLDDMTAQVRRLMGDAAHWQQASGDCQRYFESHFSVESTLDAYEAVLRRTGAAGAALAN
jgi:glycosyltransferase involved in cell wall biosynthesis